MAGLLRSWRAGAACETGVWGDVAAVDGRAPSMSSICPVPRGLPSSLFTSRPFPSERVLTWRPLKQRSVERSELLDFTMSPRFRRLGAVYELFAKAAAASRRTRTTTTSTRTSKDRIAIAERCKTQPSVLWRSRLNSSSPQSYRALDTSVEAQHRPLLPAARERGNINCLSEGGDHT